MVRATFEATYIPTLAIRPCTTLTAGGHFHGWSCSWLNHRPAGQPWWCLWCDLWALPRVMYASTLAATTTLAIAAEPLATAAAPCDVAPVVDCVKATTRHAHAHRPISRVSRGSCDGTTARAGGHDAQCTTVAHAVVVRPATRSAKHPGGARVVV